VAMESQLDMAIYGYLRAIGFQSPARLRNFRDNLFSGMLNSWNVQLSVPYSLQVVINPKRYLRESR
jgi:hypothetical protein